MYFPWLGVSANIGSHRCVRWAMNNFKFSLKMFALSVEMYGFNYRQGYTLLEPNTSSINLIDYRQLKNFGFVCVSVILYLTLWIMQVLIYRLPYGKYKFYFILKAEINLLNKNYLIKLTKSCKQHNSVLEQVQKKPLFYGCLNELKNILQQLQRMQVTNHYKIKTFN